MNLFHAQVSRFTVQVNFIARQVTFVVAGVSLLHYQILGTIFVPHTRLQTAKTQTQNITLQNILLVGVEGSIKLNLDECLQNFIPYPIHINK